MNTSVVEAQSMKGMEFAPPLPHRSPLRQFLVGDNGPLHLDDAEIYQDTRLESIDRTINEVQSLWPLLHSASTSLRNLTDSELIVASADDASSVYSQYFDEDVGNDPLDDASPPIALASPHDAPSIYNNHSEHYSSDDVDNQITSFTTPSFTASSRASSSASSMVLTPQSESPPASPPSAKSGFHRHVTTSSIALNSSFPETSLTTDDLFDLIAQIPLVDNMRHSPQMKAAPDANINAAECYFYSPFAPHPAVRPLPERNSSNRVSRTFSIRSSAISSAETESKRSSLLLMPKRMSTLRFPSIKKRQAS